MYTANMNIHNEILKKWDKDTEKISEEPKKISCMGLQLSRLERTPDKREVGGSSPLRPTKICAFRIFFHTCVPCVRGVQKENPNCIKFTRHGGVAQLGEHLPCKQGVRSSILLISTRFMFFAKRKRKQLLRNANNVPQAFQTRGDFRRRLRRIKRSC